MTRGVWWLLAIVGAFLAYKLLASANVGTFIVQNQFQLLGNLILYGTVALVIGLCVLHAIREFREYRRLDALDRPLPRGLSVARWRRLGLVRLLHPSPRRCYLAGDRRRGSGGAPGIRRMAETRRREEIAKRELKFNPRAVFGSENPEAKPEDLKKGRWVD